MRTSFYTGTIMNMHSEGVAMKVGICRDCIFEYLKTIVASSEHQVTWMEMKPALMSTVYLSTYTIVMWSKISGIYLSANFVFFSF